MSQKENIRALMLSKFMNNLNRPNQTSVRLYSPLEKQSTLAFASKPVELYSKEFFALCGIGGILSCGITHTLMTPLDLVKCNAQANPKDFTGTIQGFRKIFFLERQQHLDTRAGLLDLSKDGVLLLGVIPSKVFANSDSMNTLNINLPLWLVKIMPTNIEMWFISLPQLVLKL